MVITVQLFPVVIILKANGDPTMFVGVPLMVSIEPLTDDVTPVGSPVTVAPVAPPDKAYVIFVIGVLTQTACASVATAEVNVMA